jgi:hypothetical protein
MHCSSFEVNKCRQQFSTDAHLTPRYLKYLTGIEFGGPKNTSKRKLKSQKQKNGEVPLKKVSKGKESRMMNARKKKLTC